MDDDDGVAISAILLDDGVNEGLTATSVQLEDSLGIRYRHDHDARFVAHLVVLVGQSDCRNCRQRERYAKDESRASQMIHHLPPCMPAQRSSREEFDADA
ncbi:MAG: hypothetical protein EXQ97_06705 [Alphaproteobacteria bacterium]|nr:hypothetical protein [Alphaproteobacteria bacterium]